MFIVCLFDVSYQFSILKKKTLKEKFLGIDSIFNIPYLASFQCIFGIPLCNVGSGKVGDYCFLICHTDETIRQAIFWKYIAMKARTNTKCRVLDN